MLVAPHWNPCPIPNPIPHESTHTLPLPTGQHYPGEPKAQQYLWTGSNKHDAYVPQSTLAREGGLISSKRAGWQSQFVEYNMYTTTSKVSVKQGETMLLGYFFAWAKAALFHNCRFEKGSRRQAVCMGQLPQHGGSCCNLHSTHVQVVEQQGQSSQSQGGH
jgi:hypothetical protein